MKQSFLRALVRQKGSIVLQRIISCGKCSFRPNLEHTVMSYSYLREMNSFKTVLEMTSYYTSDSDCISTKATVGTCCTGTTPVQVLVLNRTSYHHIETWSLQDQQLATCFAFLHLYVMRPLALSVLCEFVRIVTPYSRSRDVLVIFALFSIISMFSAFDTKSCIYDIVLIE